MASPLLLGADQLPLAAPEAESEDLRLFPLPEEAIDESWAARARVPAHTQDDDLHRPPAQCERFVAAPHVDVDVAALDLGAGIR